MFRTIRVKQGINFKVRVARSKRMNGKCIYEVQYHMGEGWKLFGGRSGQHLSSFNNFKEAERYMQHGLELELTNSSIWEDMLRWEFRR